MDFSNSRKTIEKRLLEYRKKDLSLFMTSSFQTQSLPLLHIVSTIGPSIPVYFLDTGFHFPETLTFRDEVGEKLGLEIREVRSPVSKNLQKDREGRLLYISDPDHCCQLNKVMPLEPVLAKFDVWISGVRRDQTSTRGAFKEEQETAQGVLRYHPMLEWTATDIENYIEEYDLPRHPLENECPTVGCEPCTARINQGRGDSEEARGNRWSGQNKTECGLHTELAKK